MISRGKVSDSLAIGIMVLHLYWKYEVVGMFMILPCAVCVAGENHFSLKMFSVPQYGDYASTRADVTGISTWHHQSIRQPQQVPRLRNLIFLLLRDQLNGLQVIDLCKTPSNEISNPKLCLSLSQDPGYSMQMLMSSFIMCSHYIVSLMTWDVSFDVNSLILWTWKCTGFLAVWSVAKLCWWQRLIWASHHASTTWSTFGYAMCRPSLCADSSSPFSVIAWLMNW